MDSVQTLKTYNAILATTGKMLAAAQNSEWDQLIQLGESRTNQCYQSMGRIGI